MDKDDPFSEENKQSHFIEVANQFRLKEMILNLEFSGVGIQHDGGGFPTDISETCHWLTPFFTEPEDYDDLW